MTVQLKRRGTAPPCRKERDKGRASRVKIYRESLGQTLSRQLPSAIHCLNFAVRC